MLWGIVLLNILWLTTQSLAPSVAFKILDIIDKEMKGVREGYSAAKPGENNCTHYDKRGCHHCCPLITCLVAQGGGGAKHNIRIVPADRANKKNVPSGTSVDSRELLLPQNPEAQLYERALRDGIDMGGRDRDGIELFEIKNDSSSDFFLIPQGGIKGTWNGVYYRVIMNKNGVLRNKIALTASVLTKDILQRLIYSLSFIYGKCNRCHYDVLSQLPSICPLNVCCALFPVH
jgi:hypothetical protein